MKLKSVSSVFWVALSICVIFVAFGTFAPEQTEQVTGNITAFISTYFSWYYLLLIMIILVICVYLLFSRYSSIKLGKEDEDPEFSLPSWFAMLFSAGMGIGLVFWTTAEPISHAFSASPVAEPGSDQAIEEALQYSFFHWGIHAWAVYAIVALTFAYFNFHKGYPGLVSATLIPLIGERRAQGIFGKMIDILAVIATVTGVAATLGFGAMQINEGLGYLFNIPSNFPIQFAIIAASTVLFTWSAWAGINKGIKRLSNLNMSLAATILLALFIIGPTLYILNMFTHSVGNYIANFFEMGLRLPMNDEEQMNWVTDWTIFYWAWWISWAPFVGIFIARVSRGRTIKEFIIGVLAVPSLVMFIFFTVFGASAINLEANGIARISEYATETATFAMLEQYPFGYLMSLFTVMIVVIFFVTSADSATFVLGMLSTKGNIHPAGFVKVSWGVILSAFAVIMIYTGGVQSIQNMLIVAALPFSVVIILMTWSLFISLSEERPRYKNRGNKKLFVKKQD